MTIQELMTGLWKLVERSYTYLYGQAKFCLYLNI